MDFKWAQEGDYFLCKMWDGIIFSIYIYSVMAMNFSRKMENLKSIFE